MAESDNKSLKEPHSDQYDIVQKLYAELEQEREASATAANEALSMILRLQGEKAAEKMEACQYRRMAEEKIHHTEESLAIFEEVLYQKDMEIASLKFQVQVYRDVLSKTGTSSPNFVELDYLETLSLSRVNASMDNMNFDETVRRDFTLPAMRSADKCYQMDVTDEEVFSPLKRRSNPKYLNKLICTKNDQENATSLYSLLSDLSEESPVSDSNFHYGRVEDRSIKIKETSNSREIEESLESDCTLAHNEFQMSMPIDYLRLGLGHRSYSFSCTESKSPFNDSTVEVTETMLDKEHILPSSSHSGYLEDLQDFATHCQSILESDLPINKIHPAKFHDIFEVPQCPKDYNSGPKSKLFEDCISERKNVPLTTYSMPKEAREDYFKDEEWLNMTLLDGQYGTTLSSPRKGDCLEHNRACKEHKSGFFFPPNVEELWQSDIKHLNKRLQVLEDDRRIFKQEHSDRVEEQLKLLREISQQLNIICSKAKISPLKKYCHRDDALVVSFMEAILSFSV